MSKHPIFKKSYDMFARILLLSFFLCSGYLPFAQSTGRLALPTVFSDDMVLQQGIKTAVWGTSNPSQKISVTIAGKTAAATSGADGKWLVRLPVLRAGGPFTLKITAGTESRMFSNVMIGEVWVCSGQSNMEMPLAGWGKIKNYQEEIAKANYPAIRLFQAQRATSTAPMDDVKADSGKWLVCSPQTIDKFSATAYFFARRVYESQHVAIGLLHTSWGGTIAEAWASGESLKKMPDFLPAVQKIESDSARASAVIPDTGKLNPNRVTVLYNAMIHPFLQFGIRGAIWYQGESNAGRAWQYRTLFPLMIQDWRKQWKQGDFPFYFVQLANFKEPKPEPAPSDWAELREAQLLTLALPNTGMATIIDIGEAKDIHPKNKQDVGMRLALIALANTYKEKIVYTGPLYSSMKKNGAEILLSFKNTGSNLAATNGQPLQGFAIAGEDQVFHWADATIKGKEVVVSSKDVANPVSVRYAWADNPACNFGNAAGLPASPFRTDDWKMITRK